LFAVGGLLLLHGFAADNPFDALCPSTSLGTFSLLRAFRRLINADKTGNKFFLITNRLIGVYQLKSAALLCCLASFSALVERVSLDGRPSIPFTASMSLFSPPRDPFRLFSAWFKKAGKSSGLKDPNALCLSTVDHQGRPDARMLLLKGYDERGFVFYTNLFSAKGRQMARNPAVSITFHWDKLGLQVRIRGRVRKVSDREADDYFRTRPRLSQIGAWASLQSRPLSSRAELLARAARVAHRFRGTEILRPPHWTGLRVVPGQIEFWRSRPFRMHDRFLYERRGKAWRVTRLFP
jgi:pyridoxamine 5'-phosphate oxidase